MTRQSRMISGTVRVMSSITAAGEAEAEIRRQPFSERELDEAVRLYVWGLSVAAIGARLGAHPSKVWRALKARGVALRHQEIGRRPQLAGSDKGPMRAPAVAPPQCRARRSAIILCVEVAEPTRSPPECT